MIRYLMLICLTAGMAFAGKVEDYHAWHQKCLETEDAKVIDGYIAKYQAKLDADPSDQLAKVYLGSAYSLRSAQSFWGPKKLDYLKKGGRLMDEAVAAAPKDPRVRFLRGVNGYRVPKKFKRRPVAVQDFTYLLPIAEKGGHGLSKRERQAMLYYAWRTFDEEDQPAQAARAKASCHKLDAGSWYGQETRP